MEDIRVHIAEPDIAENEKRWVNDALDKNELSGHGWHVGEFEKKFAEYIGTKYAVATVNGTITLHLLLVALGIGKGDDVILPHQTISNCAFAVSLTGARVIAIDVEQDTWCMSPKELANAITPNTKAVIPVHLFGGVPCDMFTIINVIKHSGFSDKISVIEDCAESIGSKYCGKMTGSIGLAGSFSLFANKTIMTGEGGIITTDSKDLYDKLRYLRNVAYGKDPETKFWANDLGFNYRPSNLICALGLGQLERIEYLVKRRQDIHSWYVDKLNDNFEFQGSYSNCESVCWMNAVKLPKFNGHSMKSRFMRHMKDNGIETRPAFPPLGQHPYFKKLGNGSILSMDAKVSESIWENVVLLPSAGKKLTREVIYDVAETANNFFKKA